MHAYEGVSRTNTRAECAKASRRPADTMGPGPSCPNRSWLPIWSGSR